MLSHVRDCLNTAEADPTVSSRDAALSFMRRLGLDDFGEALMLTPNREFPRLSALLPKMASADVQNLWTGENGYGLLRKTCNFVRSISYNYAHISHKQLSNASLILDYGCGYGRIARLMYYFVSIEHVIGVDPWERSIAECKAAGLGPNFRLSDYLPVALPVGDKTFDLAYAFSVFTHLSQRATLTAFKALRRHANKDSVLCITIRPLEYWDIEGLPQSRERCNRLKQEHVEQGFAFSPHNLPAVDGDVTYGDTSISLEWIDRNLVGWTRVAVDRSLEDPYQIYVFLKAS